MYALDPTSGTVLWNANAGAAVPAQNLGTVGQPPSGLGAGNGLLVVPAGNLVVAYTQAPATATPTPTATPTATSTPTLTPTATATATPTFTTTPTATPKHRPKK